MMDLIQSDLHGVELGLNITQPNFFWNYIKTFTIPVLLKSDNRCQVLFTLLLVFLSPGN